MAIVKFALHGLVRRPLQSLLLLFALTAALAATMTIMAVLSGIQAQMRRDLAQVGLDVINVHVSPTLKNLLTSPLRLSDCRWLGRLSGSKEVAPFRVGMGAAEAEGGGQATQVLLLHTTARWGRIVPLQLIEGRFFVPGERGVCVLDEWVARRLFDHEPAVGRRIRLRQFSGSQLATVVGVMKDPFEIRKRFDELDVTGSARSRILRIMEFKSVYVPGRFEGDQTVIHGAVLKARPGADPVRLAAELQRAFGPRSEQVWVWARRQWADLVIDAADILIRVSQVIWVIVLLVTGVMITTVTLVAVRQRFREIAIRRTEGARRGQIAAQLVLENVLLCAVAGVGAIGLARWAGGALEHRYISWPPAFLPADIFLALVLGLLLGLLATAVPAWRAATLDPVEVLRE